MPEPTLSPRKGLRIWPLRTVATLALAVRRSNQSLTTRLDRMMRRYIFVTTFLSGLQWISLYSFYLLLHYIMCPDFIVLFGERDFS
jgi:hypothetical protein